MLNVNVETPKSITPFLEIYGDNKHGSVMSPGKSKDEFGMLDVPVMRLKERSDKRYRVYKTPTETVDVEANTAQEAISLSGIENPYKVLHLVMSLDGVISQSMLTKIEPDQVIPEAPLSEDTSQKS
jgi:hypothetical protein